MAGKPERIAAALRELITSGQLGPGTELPSEAQLKADWRVARETVRAAYRDLEDAGLVMTAPGQPRRVRDRIMLEITLTRGADRVTGVQAATRGADAWPHDILAIGRVPSADLHVADDAACPADVAARLGVPAGARVTRRELLRRVDGQPHNLNTWYFPPWAGPELAAPHDIPEGTIALLGRLGLAPGGFHVEFGAARPGAEARRRLGVHQGTPLIIEYRTGLGLGGRVFVTKTLWPADRTWLRSEL